MPRGEYANLAELRERLLGYKQEAVSRLGGIPLERLEEIESSDSNPTVYELDVLARLYGLDADVLAEQPIRLQRGDSIEVLALQDEFQEVHDGIKALVVAAANAVKDLTWLRRKSGSAIESGGVVERLQYIPRPPVPQPWAQGRWYAERLRKEVGLGSGPIGSLRDFVGEYFPGVTVLYAHLGKEGIAGLAFADAMRDPTIVLNLDGKNENPCVRRFSLAHELFHLLVDRGRRDPLASLSGFLSEERIEREQRANGFASRLICPEDVVRNQTEALGAQGALKVLVDEYGLHLDAARLYLRNVENAEIPSRPEHSVMGRSVASHWRVAEQAEGIEGFPVERVPPERRTEVAILSARLYAAGEIQRDRFAALLDVTPVEDVERVLDLFNLDVPR